MGDVLARLLDPVPLVLWTGVGALLTHAWRRLRNRLAVLSWQVEHLPLGAAEDDTRFGKIRLLYNDRDVYNLFLTSLRVQNDSQRDLTDVNLTTQFMDGTLIFVSHAQLEGAPDGLNYAPAYSALLEQSQAWPEDSPQRVELVRDIIRRRAYHVPVLNRGQGVLVQLLVQGPADRRWPFLSVSCVHPGVKLVFKPPPQYAVLGVARKDALPFGIVLAAGGAVLLATALSLSPAAAAILGYLAGAFVLAIGAAVVRLYRWLVDMMS